MTDDWTNYVMIACAILILWRIDRLGRQLEAVCANIKAELSSPDRANEIIREWKEEKSGQDKNQRIQLIFWGVIGAVAIAWGFASRH